jgi:hypothetical protein
MLYIFVGSVPLDDRNCFIPTEANKTQQNTKLIKYMMFYPFITCSINV